MSLAEELRAFGQQKKEATPPRSEPTKPTKPISVGFVGGNPRDDRTFFSSEPVEQAGTLPPPPTSDNPYIEPDTWSTWAESFGSNGEAVKAALELEGRALNLDIPWRQAWDIAQAVALYAHHIKDGRRACLECRNYRHRKGTLEGRCMAAAYPPNHHMKHGGAVPVFQLSRCKAYQGPRP